MDYADLREEGIRHLERLAGDSWTDFNAHDPGITILESVAYALSDLMYRAGHSVPDLLASSGSDPHEGLFSPRAILHGDPVTASDLRKIVVDVAGVRNAWIEPAADSTPELHYHPFRREVGLEADPPVSERIVPVGLYRVLVDAADPAASGAVRAQVARRLHAHRPLCNDFTEIRVLDPQPVQVVAHVEIAELGDPDEVLLGVLDAIVGELSPVVRFMDPGELAAGAMSIDHVLDGPLLDHGFLDTVELAASQRPTAVRTSDLVQRVMDVQGVRAITKIAVAVGGAFDSWSVELDTDNIADLDLENSTIVVTRSGVPVGGGVRRVAAEFARRRQHAARPTAPASRAFEPPSGRDRAVGTYFSIQHHLPALYGIAEMGLPASADPARRAQARQLKTYLLFFDQILADLFARLAHVGDLFSFHTDSARTDFTSAVADPRLELDDLRVDDLDDHRQRLDDLATVRARTVPTTPGGETIHRDRKDRFLEHVLSLFAERLPDTVGAAGRSTDEFGEDGDRADGLRRIEAQAGFLRRYPQISGKRGTAADALAPLGGDNESGLAERIRLLLGLRDGEKFLLVEQLLLRPVPGDGIQTVPVLTEADVTDPYSLRISFVFALAEGRMHSEGFRRLVADTVRRETPAHLVANVQWLPPDEWTDFHDAHKQWWQHRRRALAKAFDLDVAAEPDDGGRHDIA